MMISDTWTCHICGDERPDAAISVQKNKSVVAGVEVDNNVRYCNDRPACFDAAQTKVFAGKELR